jgi:hypothetical protein
MAPALAQDADPDIDTGETLEDVAPEAEPEPEPEPEEEPVDYDETGLDEQGFSDEDDDFDPTEVIPTDQSIDFPADI